jgi:hypothetical protein
MIHMKGLEKRWYARIFWIVLDSECTFEKTEGTATPSLASKLLDQHPVDTPNEEECIKWTLASLYGGGTDTVSVGKGAIDS